MIVMNFKLETDKKGIFAAKKEKKNLILSQNIKI